MDMISTKVYEANIAAALLALGIQNINRISQEQLDKVYDYTIDSLNRAGINIEFPEIKEINTLPIHEAQSKVIEIKSKIIATLQVYCGPLASQLFELTFNIYLVSTTPEEFSNVGDYLKQLAQEVGFKDANFMKILNSLKTDIEVGLPEYEKGIEALLETEEVSSFLDLFEMKPGFMGFNVDIKMAIEKYRKWRGI